MKKIKPLTAVAIALMVISLSIIDFGNLSSAENYKGFAGLIGFLILISFDLYLRKKRKNLD